MQEVFAMLSADHRTVERLFSQFEQTEDPSVAWQICDELTVHTLVEEELVYPLLASKVGTGYADEARHEHQEAKELITRIEAGLRDGADVAPLVHELKRGVQHHVQEEEGEIFPEMAATIPTLVRAMGDELAARKREFQEKLAEARSLGEPSWVVANANKPTTSP